MPEGASRAASVDVAGLKDDDPRFGLLLTSSRWRREEVVMSTATPRRGGVLREGYENDFSLMDPAVGAHVDPSWCAVFETDTLADASGAHRRGVIERL